MVSFSPYLNFAAPRFKIPEKLKEIVERKTSPAILYELKIPKEERDSGTVSEGEHLAYDPFFVDGFLSLDSYCRKHFVEHDSRTKRYDYSIREKRVEPCGEAQ